MNLKSDDSFAIRGVLWSARGPWLTLRQAAAIRANGSSSPIDGEAIVHRDNIAFLQVVR